MSQEARPNSGAHGRLDLGCGGLTWLTGVLYFAWGSGGKDPFPVIVLCLGAGYFVRGALARGLDKPSAELSTGDQLRGCPAIGLLIVLGIVVAALLQGARG